MKKILFLFGAILAISACTSSDYDYEYDNDEMQRTESYDETYDRLTNNIFIKEKAPYSITYEYKDVRVDDIAVLAARYCKETYNTLAHLKSITLHKNNYRLATFHCHNLQ